MQHDADGLTDLKPVPPIVSSCVHTKDSQNAGSRVTVILKNDRVNNILTRFYCILYHINRYKKEGLFFYNTSTRNIIENDRSRRKDQIKFI